MGQTPRFLNGLLEHLFALLQNLQAGFVALDAVAQHAQVEFGRRQRLLQIIVEELGQSPPLAVFRLRSVMSTPIPPTNRLPEASWKGNLTFHQ
jgi:hypothetical protein